MGYSPPQPFTTPNGRTVNFPPEFAAQFQGLTPVQPEPLGPAPAPPAETGAQPTGLLPPTPPPQVATPSDSAVLAPPEEPKAPPSGNGVGGFIQSVVPPEFTASAPSVSPEPIKEAAIPKPRTDADLGKIGQAGALNAATSALDQQAEAGRRAADVEAAAQLRMADAFQQRNAEIDAQLQERQRAAEERLQRVNAAHVEANQAMKAYADHKVSREVDHPTLALIGVALGGLGAAMKGGDNQALNLLIQQMDKKVQLQLADRDKLKDVAGMKRSAIDQVRQAGDDKIAMYNLAMAGETDKAIRKIEEIKTRSSLDSVKANADLMVAGLRERQAGLLGQAVDRRLSREDAERRAAEAAKQHAQGIGVQIAQMRQADRHFYDNLKFQREKEQTDLAAEAMKLAAKGKADEAKLVRERGIGGAREVVRDEKGSIVTEPDGTPQVRYTALKNRDGAPFVPQGSDASIDKLRNQKAAADSLVGIIDEVQSLGPEWLSDTRNSDKLQQLRALWASAKLETKDFKELGVIAGPDEKLIEEFLGTGDPTRWRDGKAGMTQARKNILAGINTKLRAAGFDGEYSPADMSKLRPAKAPEEKSAQDVLRDPWRMDAQRVEAELGAGRTQEVADKLREAGGMLPSQRAALDNFAHGAASPDPKVRDASLEWLTKAANSAQAPAVRKYAGDLLRANTERVTQETPVPREPLPIGVK